jgi:hypothetical protein
MAAGCGQISRSRHQRWAPLAACRGINDDIGRADKTSLAHAVTLADGCAFPFFFIDRDVFKADTAR